MPFMPGSSTKAETTPTIDPARLAAVGRTVDGVEDDLLSEGLRDGAELDDGIAHPIGRAMKSLERKKSVIRIVIEATTTATVVARPTPSAPRLTPFCR